MKKLIIGVLAIAMVTMMAACGEKPAEPTTPPVEEIPVEEAEEIEEPQEESEQTSIDTLNTQVDKAFNLLKKLYEDKNIDFNYDKISSESEKDENGLLMDAYKLSDKLNCCIFYKDVEQGIDSILIFGQKIETLDELDATVNLGASFISVVSEQDLETYISTIGKCIDNSSADTTTTDNLYMEIDCTESPAIFISRNIK